ncbi:EF-P lysine aminoacylase EpmA [uncultured Aquimonas sp.]|uniref:EF-P lysine aminoacylase EpmA n=1 Tax=uncultured Aquimonas sp. TaxID=385483 RepID=UPI000869BFE9|nr:EF-P lysine aminoacylase EpmA [uncultured Aquimonas sp.]ODU45516.1 MAG: EF-P lysine aminoacylase GenX [Xanthomonadaceae bacterium SCN 69-123]
MLANWRPGASTDALVLRARLNQCIRAFFAARGVLEVETPLMSAAANTEPNIRSFALDYSGPNAGPSRRRYLRTSPEFPLKRLLAAGVGDCYELGRVFRDGECGGRHNPEFTMLEWYRLGIDHYRLMDEVAELLLSAFALVGRVLKVRRASYRALFCEHIGIDPALASEPELRAALAGHDIDADGLERDDWLDLLLTHRIEPALPRDELLLLHDFPASQCALARVAGEGVEAHACRFEVYVGGVELANGYHELSDAQEQRARFERDNQRRRARGDVELPIDEHLLAALQHGLPDCAGVALGVDRLMMLLSGAERIDQVIAFAGPRA